MSSALFSALMPLTLPAAGVLGLLIDRWLGEPRRAHPLIFFGNWANRLEAWLNPLTQVAKNTATRPDPATGKAGLRLRGLLAWSLAVLPPVLALWWLQQQLPAVLSWGLDAVLLWFAVGHKSLIEHGQAIFRALDGVDLPLAREQVGRIVSRDTSALDAEGVTKAGIESILENGNDAVFAAVFWFLLLGGPGAVLFRLLNTLDAMWGYKTERFLHFGWAAARLDDLFNYLPARLTALTYGLQQNWHNAWLCWRHQAPLWDSPNAGPVMAAGAGSLGVLLGGNACYHGQTENRPTLGIGNAPEPDDLPRAMQLVSHGIWWWMLVWSLLVLLSTLPALHGVLLHG